MNIDNLISRYPLLSACREDIENAAELMIKTYRRGRKILLAGNGGSSADCDHIVGELMKGFLQKRRVTDTRIQDDIRRSLQGALPAISLPAQTALYTAFANDVDADMAYAQATLGYANEGDLFIGISTSGNAKNVVLAAKVAAALGCATIALTGECESQLSEICDISIKAPEDMTYRIQELHLPIYHYLAARVEEELFPDDE